VPSLRAKRSNSRATRKNWIAPNRRIEFSAHSATPNEYLSFVDQISKMWAEQRNWSDVQLKAIDTPILVADGDHDEGDQA
jgi:hypothetical protein